MIYILGKQDTGRFKNMSLGMRIKTLRKALEITQQQLADKTDVSRIYIQALESNRRLPSMKVLNRLASALEVDVTDLVQSMPSDKRGRLHLEEILDKSTDVEIWYRSKKLSNSELQFVQRLIDAALEKWEKEDEES
jgi:transcriptional regulator with XRE-family HTH domain